MKDELGRKIMTKSVGLKAKTYSYLTDNGIEDEKAKATKKCAMKRKLKFENYKNCLEVTYLEQKIYCREKNKISLDGLKKLQRIHKKQYPILKTQQRFKSERHNAFTEEINNIALSSKNKLNKIIQSIDSIKTYAYGMSKDLLSEKEEIKCNNIIILYKKLLTLTM